MCRLRRWLTAACAALAVAAWPALAQVDSPQTGQPPQSKAAVDSALQLYGARLLQTGHKHRGYPAAALEQKLTGVATIEIGIGADGKVKHKSLVGSSSHSVLDEHAMQLMELALPLTEIPSALTGRAFTLRVSVNYVLPEYMP